MRFSEVILTSLAASVAMPAAAQDAVFADWQYASLGEGLESYTATGNAALVMVADVETTHFAGGDEGAIIARMSATVEQMCPGLTEDAISPRKQDRFLRAMTIAPGVTCVALVVSGNEGTQGAIILATPATLVDAESKARQLISRRAGAASAVAPQTSRSTASTSASDLSRLSAPPTNADPIEAQLKRAAATIPTDRRPVSSVSHGTGSYSGWPPSYTYIVTSRMLFPNGMAARCLEWDPAIYAPIPSSAPFKEAGCDLLAWRKRNGVTEFQAEDGSWSSADTAEGVFGFKPGERIDVTFGNVGATGFDFGSGGISTGTISGGTLRMTADGQIAVGDWSTTVISGSNVGGGSSRVSGPKIGRYYLDGHIIVIMDEAGQISRGFIGAVAGDSGNRIGHIYLNGQHYWDSDD